MSGKGKLVWKNGKKYEGDFENGDFNGFGVYTMKVIGRMTWDQEKENLSGKMDQSKNKYMKMVH